MRIVLLAMTSLLMIIGSSCTQTEQIKTKQCNNMNAREIVDKNAFIDYTMEDLIVQSRSTNTIVAAHPAFRAAAHRFYKTVKMDEKGFATWSAKSGKELNMSENLFNHFVKITEKGNKMMEESIKKGENLQPMDLSDEYLNNIIDDDYVNNILNMMKEAINSNNITIAK